PGHLAAGTTPGSRSPAPESCFVPGSSTPAAAEPREGSPTGAPRPALRANQVVPAPYGPRGRRAHPLAARRTGCGGPAELLPLAGSQLVDQAVLVVLISCRSRARSSSIS